jgi:hypothetical protein
VKEGLLPTWSLRSEDITKAILSRASIIRDVVCICIITEIIFLIFLNDGDVLHRKIGAQITKYGGRSFIPEVLNTSVADSAGWVL